MRVLILGAGGFLGRHVAALLSSQEDLSVSCAPASRELDLSTASAAAWCGLLDATCPDVIVNCAGRTDGSPAALHLANVALVERLVQAALTRRAPPRIIHLGSAAEYGPGPVQVREDAPTRPASPYGQAKLTGTRTLLGAPARLHRVVLRPFNPLGAGQAANTVAGRAARQFRQAAQEGWPSVTFGSLGAQRDFIAADDVARAVLTALRHPEAPPVLNVGRGESRPVREVVQTLARLSGFTGDLREDAPGSSRSSGVSRQWADIGHLRVLGWAPLTSLEAALHDVWRATPPPPVRPVPAALAVHPAPPAA